MKMKFLDMSFWWDMLIIFTTGLIFTILFTACMPPDGLCPCSQTRIYDSYEPCNQIVVCGEIWGDLESRNRRFNVTACDLNQRNMTAECKAIFQNYTDCLGTAQCDKFQCQAQAYTFEKHCGGEKKILVDAY